MMDNVIGDDSIMDDLSYLLEDNMRVDSVMDLDLNQEPLDPSSGSGIVFGSLFNELGTTTNQIDDRILHLEGFRARARQRQRWRQARIHLPGNLDVLIGTMGSSEGTEQNGESGEPSTGSRLRLAQGFLLDDQETAHSQIQDRIQHSQIENRIRQLEAVNARARQRQRWRQARNHLPETSDALVESTEGTEQNRETVERVKSCKRDSSHLVAKALELDMEVKKVVSEGGGFFDCNVCLDMARDPILTCCGHLFCWACFYQLPYVYSTAKECPVCKGEVTDSNVTPIFGNGDSNCVSELESGVKVPPRPQAHRIESVRQQRAESVRRIRMQLAARGGDPSQQQDLNPATIDGHIPISELSRNPLLGGGSRRLRSRPFVRVLSEADASLSSTSSELDNPRLFEDYAVMRIQDALMGRTRERILRFDRGNPSTSRAAAEENHHQTLDSAAEINSTATLASSSERADVSSSDGQLENLRTDAPTQMDLTEPSPSTRRRNRLSGVSETDNGASRAPRRRRLNYIL